MNYPKPSYNTRIAMHLSANQYSAASGDPRYFLNECKQMGVSWVKGLTDRDAGATDWIPIAFEMGLMPVVRIYQPMPWNLDATIKKAIDRLVAMGVRYIETINEPDNKQEWDPVPIDWAEQAARQQIEVARYIQAAGGIPLIASLSTGSHTSYTDMTLQMVEQGGADVFEKGFVMSIHNYPLNHPIGLEEWDQTDTYPLDDVNQNGTPISEEMYHKYGEQNSLAWEGRSREWVNNKRIENMNPGETPNEDNCGEINLEYVAEAAYNTLGFYPMCIVTEGGVVIGDVQDDRYPKNTGEYMRDANVEIAKRCNGTSTTPYPDYVLAGGGYWLLGNYRMGHNSSNWESQAWYTDTWPQYNSGGRLWVVDSMKAMPKVAYGTPYEPPIEPPPVEPPPAEGGWVIKSQRRVPGSEWNGRHAEVYGKVYKGGESALGVEVKYWWDGMTPDQNPRPTKTDEYDHYKFTLSVGQFYVQVEDGEIAGPLNTHLKPEEEEPGMTTGHVKFEVDFEWREAVEPPVEPPIGPIPLIIEMLPGVFAEDWREIIRGEYPWKGSFDERPWPSAPDLVGLAFHWYGKKDGVDPEVMAVAKTFYDKNDPGVGYHYQVTQNGVLRWLVAPEKVAWGIAGKNDLYLHVLAEPTLDGLMTEAQVIACRRLRKAIDKGLDKKLQVVGHSEVAATECPGPLWEENKTRIMDTDVEPPIDDWQEKYIEEVKRNAKLSSRMSGMNKVAGEAIALLQQLISLYEEV